MRFSHVKFAAAFSVSLLLSILSLLSAGDAPEAVLLAEITVPVFLAAFALVAILEKRYRGRGGS